MDLELIKAKIRAKLYVTDPEFKNAIISGHTDKVKELAPTIYVLDMYHELDLAVMHGHLEIVKYFWENWKTFSNINCYNALELAAANGYVDIVKYLVESTYYSRDPKRNLFSEDIESFRDTLQSALNMSATNGFITVVQYLTELGYVDVNGFAHSVIGGHLDVVKYLAPRYMHLVVKPNCEIRDRSKESLRSWIFNFYKQLDLFEIQCGHQTNNFTIGSYVIRRAVEIGHLDIVKYLLDINCPFDKKELVKYSLGSKNIKIMSYLLSQDFSYDLFKIRVLVWLKISGQQKIISRLGEKKLPCDISAYVLTPNVNIMIYFFSMQSKRKQMKFFKYYYRHLKCGHKLRDTNTRVICDNLNQRFTHKNMIQKNNLLKSVLKPTGLYVQSIYF
jgi:hypothetical protein